MKNPESLVHTMTPWATSVTLALPLLMASLGTSITNIALPALAEAFAVPFATVQWVAISYLAAMTLSTVFVGRLGDSHGHQRVLAFGLGLFVLASTLAAVAQSFQVLVGARALQGIGAAILMTLSLTLMRKLAGEKGVGRAMGLLGTVSAVGTALGPSLGGLLLPLAGWRAIFLVQVPLAALALVLAVVVLPRADHAPKLVPTRLLMVLNPPLARILFINFAVAAVMMTTLIVGPFFLSLGLGLQATTVGVVMSIGPLVAIFSGAPAGRLVDALGTQRAMGIGLAVMAAGAVTLALLPSMIGVSGYVIALAVLTPGYQLAQAANNTTALMNVSRDSGGAVSGLLALSRNVGLIAGASGMGAVFAFGVGSVDVANASSTALTSGMRLTFLVAASLIGLAFALASMRQGPAR